MAGALLGLGVGGLLGYAGERHRERRAQEQQARDFSQKAFADTLQRHPEAIFNPDIDKQGKKEFGAEWEIMKPSFQYIGSQTISQRKAAANFLRTQGPQGMAMANVLDPPAGGQSAPGGMSMPGPGAAAPPNVSRGTSLAAPAPGAGGAPPSTLPPTSITGPSGVIASQAAAPPPTLPPASVTGPGMPPTPPVQAPPQGVPAPGGPTTAPPGAAPPAAITPDNMADSFMRLGEAYLLSGDKDNAAQWTKMAELAQKQQKTGQLVKPPADLDALSHAQFGKGFYQLDQASQQKAMELYQQFKGEPALQAFNRSSKALDDRQDKALAAQQVVQDRRDAMTMRRYGIALRASVTAFNEKQEAQKELAIKTSTSEEELNAKLATINAAADAKEQEMQDSAADLPSGFTYPKIVRYAADPAQPGVIKALTGGRFGGETPGPVHPVAGASSPESPAPPKAPQSLWGKKGVTGPDGRRWDIDDQGNPSPAR